jgi:Leucine-rich repeat (LRR) protein
MSSASVGAHRVARAIRLLCCLATNGLFFVCLFLHAAHAALLRADELVLVDLYWSTSGNLTWKNSTGWLDNAVGACSWFGVTCGPANCSSHATAAPCRVVSLKLGRNNVAGPIPWSLGQLNAMQWLDLSRNQMSGTIPQSLANLTSLSIIDLSYNRLEGDVGALDFLGRFPALRNCSLSSNFLVGSVPMWLLNVSSVLHEFQAADNRLTGSIPPWIGQLSSLRRLHLGNNSFSGTIPPSLADMSALVQLTLTYNANISGSLPSSIGNLRNLTLLAMGKMNLSGTLPTSMCDLVELQVVYLDTNALTGTIPCDLRRLVRLQTFEMHSNRIGGTIPESLFSLVELRRVQLYENLFVGSLSANIGSAPLLSSFDVALNKLTGLLPVSISNLSFLFKFNVSFNQLDGTLPRSMASLRLNSFAANSNRLSGSLPLWLGSLTTISVIELKSNQFSGPIPSNLCSLDSELTSIDLSDNMLSSFDAAALFSCPYVATLDLSRNRIRQNLDFRRSIHLPPLINLSYNQLGPALAEYSAPASGFSVSVIDIRSNSFLCPFPSNFPIEIALLFSPCEQPWSTLLVYAAVFVGSIIVLIGVTLLLARFVSTLAKFVTQSTWVVFVVSWVGDSAGLVLDAVTLQLILSYLAATIDHCVGINYFGYFGPQTLLLYEETNCMVDPQRDYRPFPPSTTLHEFFAACRAAGGAKVPALVIDPFRALCARTLPQCDFDPVTITCRTFYPELDSDARGEVHQVFFGIVIAVAVVRVIIELSRMACVFVAYRRMSNLAVPVDVRACVCSGTAVPVHWIAELVGTSIASPLLYFSSRAEFVALHLQREPSAGDFVFRALHAGLLTAVPLLGVNMWYLLRVAQYGLAPAGWLSLMKGMVLVPRLLFQAYRATRPGAGKHQRAASEAAGRIDPSTAFESGADAAAVAGAAVAVGSVTLLELAAQSVSA